MAAPKKIQFDADKDRMIRAAYQNGHRKSGEVHKLAQTLGISLTSIHRRAAFLGVVRASNKTQVFWSPAEIDLLEQNAHHTVGHIINVLIKAGYPRRTEHSIFQKMKRLGIGQREARYDAGIYSVSELSRLSGINIRTLVGYIDKGWLKATRRKDIEQIEYLVKSRDVRQFIKDYAPNVDLLRFDKYFLIDVLTGEIK